MSLPRSASIATKACSPIRANPFLGYRLLTEYFAFPEKFLFLDLGGFGRLPGGVPETRGRPPVLEPQFVQAGARHHIRSTFRLGCTPVINLFEQTAEPMPLTQARYEYRIVPDVANPEGMEVYSVDDGHQRRSDRGNNGRIPALLFVPPRHRPAKTPRRSGMPRDGRRSARRTEESRTGAPKSTSTWWTWTSTRACPADPTLVVRTTCTNREPAGEPAAGGRTAGLRPGSGGAAGAASAASESPSKPLRPPLRRGTYWRLISHLCLNHLSLANSVEGREALQEILRLYDFSDPGAGPADAMVTRHLIDGHQRGRAAGE